MKQKSFFFLASLLMTLSIALTSCSKDESNEQEDSTASEVIDESFVESVYEEVQDMADQAYQIELDGLKSTTDDFIRFGDCVTITLDTSVMPRVLTIDFGEENCLCRDGKYRRGQIISTFNGRYRQTGTVITHGFNNFYVNNNHVEGSKVIENMGLNDDGYMWFTIQVNGQVTMDDDGTILSWESNRTRTWIVGSDTPRWYDDIYLIGGTSSFSNSNGRGREMEIITPLRRELSCNHFVSGTIQINPVNRPQMILDYGQGVCDNMATITIGDRIIIIRLP